MMKIDLKGKVALVTGGAIGIGKGIAIALSNAGAKVIITSRQKNQINFTLRKLNKNCIGLNLDVTNDRDLNELHEIIMKKFKRLDILINNVGHTLGIKDPFAPINDWKKILDLNLLTTINVTNKFI